MESLIWRKLSRFPAPAGPKKRSRHVLAATADWLNSSLLRVIGQFYEKVTCNFHATGSPHISLL